MLGIRRNEMFAPTSREKYPVRSNEMRWIQGVGDGLRACDRILMCSLSFEQCGRTRRPAADRRATMQELVRHGSARISCTLALMRHDIGDQKFGSANVIESEQLRFDQGKHRRGIYAPFIIPPAT